MGRKIIEICPRILLFFMFFICSVSILGRVNYFTSNLAIEAKSNLTIDSALETLYTQIINPITGDNNTNSTVNATDIIEVLNYMMGFPSEVFNDFNADVNGDGFVNVADVVKIVNICLGLDDNASSSVVIQIDSLVFQSNSTIELSPCDTISIDLEVYPKTVSLSDIMISEHQIYLERIMSGKVDKPTEFKLISMEKVEQSSDTHNVFRLYLADTDAGYGYKDSVRICYQSLSSIVKSDMFVLKNAGTSLFSFSLGDETSSWDSFYTRNDTIMIQVPISFNLKSATAIFKHNGIGVYYNNKLQLSGEETKDYTDFCNPPEYIVKGFDGEERKYTIEVFNLPIIYVNTPDSVEITSRNEWLGNCSFTIRDTDGTIEDYGEANVKGRGNWTWRQGLADGKKPYAIKLANKPKDKTVLGMPGHKRWVLLSNPVSYLPNPIGFEVNRRSETCKWAPRSRFVELILNGKHRGLYLLCEQIRIDKNRLNIKEMKETDIEGDAVTGGFLISYDDATEDDDPMYYSHYFNMPFMIKNPDTDNIQPVQLEYISNYINEAELSLYDDERFSNGDFNNFFDVDSWIDYYFVEELWGGLEMKRPRSIWLYKDRGGKLSAGPVWDMESNFFDKYKFYCNTALYYGRLFQSNEVVSRMKIKWPYFRSNLVGNEKYDCIIKYIDSLYDECHLAADRDRKMTPASFYGHLPYEDCKIDYEYQVIRNNILVKLEWLENQIMLW